MTRELIVLGTSSQVPTRRRNHHGYLLRWDEEGILFDPGEGTQRQMLFAGASSASLTRLCLTHFHGDHCLGVPGVIARLSLDGVHRPVEAYFPASGQEFFARLRHASLFRDVSDVRANPVGADGRITSGPFGELHARHLDHSVEAIGYQLVEPDGRRFVPELLARAGVADAAVGVLQRRGSLEVGAATVRLTDVTVPHFSQRYPDTGRHHDEAAEVFTGELVVAEDLMRVPVPARVK